MKILHRYILREAAVYFLISLVTFTGILLTVRMLRLASLIINKGVEFSQISMVFLAIVPAFMEVAIPLATLLGVMLAFGRLSGDSEIIVMRASGISILQLVRPLLLFGLFCGTLNIVVSLHLSPWGFQVLSRTLFEIARSKSTAGLEPGVFNKLGELTLYTEKVDYASGTLAQVLIDDRRKEEERKVIVAKSGRIVSDERQRTITLLLKDGSIHEQSQGKYVITAFDKNSVGMSSDEMLSSDMQSRRNNREFSLPEIRAEIGKFERGLELLATMKPSEDKPDEPPHILMNGEGPALTAKDLNRKIRKLRVEAARRFSMPYASFILALVALPLGIQQPRSQKTWGAGLSAALGLVVFIIYYGLLSIGVALAESGKIAPVIGLWIPNIVATAIAAVMIWKMGTEQWQSIAQRFEETVKAILVRMQRTRVA